MALPPWRSSAPGGNNAPPSGAAAVYATWQFDPQQSVLQPPAQMFAPSVLQPQTQQPAASQAALYSHPAPQLFPPNAAGLKAPTGVLLGAPWTAHHSQGTSPPVSAASASSGGAGSNAGPGLSWGQANSQAPSSHPATDAAAGAPWKETQQQQQQHHHQTATSISWTAVPPAQGSASWRQDSSSSTQQHSYTTRGGGGGMQEEGHGPNGPREFEEGWGAAQSSTNYRGGGQDDPRRGGKRPYSGGAPHVSSHSRLSGSPSSKLLRGAGERPGGGRGGMHSLGFPQQQHLSSSAGAEDEWRGGEEDDAYSKGGGLDDERRNAEWRSDSLSCCSEEGGTGPSSSVPHGLSSRSSSHHHQQQHLQAPRSRGAGGPSTIHHPAAVSSSQRAGGTNLPSQRGPSSRSASSSLRGAAGTGNSRNVPSSNTGALMASQTPLLGDPYQESLHPRGAGAGATGQASSRPSSQRGAAGQPAHRDGGRRRSGSGGSGRGAAGSGRGARDGNHPRDSRGGGGSRARGSSSSSGLRGSERGGGSLHASSSRGGGSRDATWLGPSSSSSSSSSQVHARGGGGGVSRNIPGSEWSADEGDIERRSELSASHPFASDSGAETGPVGGGRAGRSRRRSGGSSRAVSLRGGGASRDRGGGSALWEEDSEYSYRERRAPSERGTGSGRGSGGSRGGGGRWLGPGQVPPIAHPSQHHSQGPSTSAPPALIDPFESSIPLHESHHHPAAHYGGLPPPFSSTTHPSIHPSALHPPGNPWAAAPVMAARGTSSSHHAGTGSASSRRESSSRRDNASSHSSSSHGGGRGRAESDGSGRGGGRGRGGSSSSSQHPLHPHHHGPPGLLAHGLPGNQQTLLPHPDFLYDPHYAPHPHQHPLGAGPPPLLGAPHPHHAHFVLPGQPPRSHALSFERSRREGGGRRSVLSSSSRSAGGRGGGGSVVSYERRSAREGGHSSSSSSRRREGGSSSVPHGGSGSGVQELPQNSWTLKGAVYVHPPQETQRLLTLFSRFVSAAAADGYSASSHRGGRSRGRLGGDEGFERGGSSRERRDRRREYGRDGPLPALGSDGEGVEGLEERKSAIGYSDAIDDAPSSRAGRSAPSLRGAFLQPACAALLLTSLPNLKAAVIQRLLTLHVRHWTGLRCPVFVSVCPSSGRCAGWCVLLLPSKDCLRVLLKAPLFAWKTKQAHQAIERVRKRRLQMQKQTEETSSAPSDKELHAEGPLGNSPAASPASRGGASSCVGDGEDEEEEDYGERCAQPHLLLWPEGQFSLNARLGRVVENPSEALQSELQQAALDFSLAIPLQTGDETERGDDSALKAVAASECFLPKLSQIPPDRLSAVAIARKTFQIFAAEERLYFRLPDAAAQQLVAHEMTQHFQSESVEAAEEDAGAAGSAGGKDEGGEKQLKSEEVKEDAEEDGKQESKEEGKGEAKEDTKGQDTKAEDTKAEVAKAEAEEECKDDSTSSKKALDKEDDGQTKSDSATDAKTDSKVDIEEPVLKTETETNSKAAMEVDLKVEVEKKTEVQAKKEESPQKTEGQDPETNVQSTEMRSATEAISEGQSHLMAKEFGASLCDEPEGGDAALYSLSSWLTSDEALCAIEILPVHEDSARPWLVKYCRAVASPDAETSVNAKLQQLLLHRTRDAVYPAEWLAYEGFHFPLQFSLANPTGGPPPAELYLPFVLQVLHLPNVFTERLLSELDELLKNMFQAEGVPEAVLQHQLVGWQVFEFSETARARGDGLLLLPDCLESSRVLQLLEKGAVGEVEDGGPCSESNGSTQVAREGVVVTLDSVGLGNAGAESGSPVSSAGAELSAALYSSSSAHHLHFGVYAMRVSPLLRDRDLPYLCCLANHLLLQLLHLIAPAETLSSCRNFRGCCECSASSVSPGSEGPQCVCRPLDEKTDELLFPGGASVGASVCGAALLRRLAPVRLRPPLPFAVPPMAAADGSTQAAEGQQLQPPLLSFSHFAAACFFSEERLLSIPKLSKFVKVQQVEMTDSQLQQDNSQKAAAAPSSTASTFVSSTRPEETKFRFFGGEHASAALSRGSGWRMQIAHLPTAADLHSPLLSPTDLLELEEQKRFRFMPLSCLLLTPHHRNQAHLPTPLQIQRSRRAREQRQQQLQQQRRLQEQLLLQREMREQQRSSRKTRRRAPAAADDEEEREDQDQVVQDQEEEIEEDEEEEDQEPLREEDEEPHARGDQDDEEDEEEEVEEEQVREGERGIQGEDDDDETGAAVNGGASSPSPNESAADANDGQSLASIDEDSGVADVTEDGPPVLDMAGEPPQLFLQLQELQTRLAMQQQEQSVREEETSKPGTLPSSDDTPGNGEQNSLNQEEEKSAEAVQPMEQDEPPLANDHGNAAASNEGQTVEEENCDNPEVKSNSDQHEHDSTNKAEEENGEEL